MFLTRVLANGLPEYIFVNNVWLHIIVVVNVTVPVNMITPGWWLAADTHKLVSFVFSFIAVIFIYVCVYMMYRGAWGGYKLKSDPLELESKWCELLDVNAETYSQVLSSSKHFHLQTHLSSSKFCCLWKEDETWGIIFAPQVEIRDLFSKKGKASWTTDSCSSGSMILAF